MQADINASSANPATGVAAAPPVLAPCPFCGCDDIATSDRDDDSFVKALVASCQGCGCSVESSLDWRPYSATRDYAGFEAAWRAKIAGVWNTRAAARPVVSNETSDWVNCPVCGESDMNKTTNEDGDSLIRCVNHACASNGGTNSSCLDAQRSASTPACPAAPAALTLKQALRAEEAGGILTGMSSSRAAALLAQSDVKAQPLLHKLLMAALTNALAMEELGRVLEHVRNESQDLCEAQPGTTVNG